MAVYVISCALVRHIPGKKLEYAALMSTICMSQPETAVEAEQFFRDEFIGSDKERQGWIMKGDSVICPFYRDNIQKWDEYIDERPTVSSVQPGKGAHLTVVK